MNRYKKGITFRRVMVLLGIFLSMMALMRFTAGRVAVLSQGQGVIDLDFGISIRETADAIAGYTASAAKFYRFVFLSVDLVYALCYCAFYRNAIRYFCFRTGASEYGTALLGSLPVIGMAADLLENTVLFLLLGAGSQPLLLCGTFTVCNFVKFVLVYLSLAVVLIGAVRCTAKMLTSREHQTKQTEQNK